MSFIKKIFEEKWDAGVHAQFVRYGVGEYTKKALVKIKNGPTAKIITGFEYVNDILWLIAEHAKGEISVNGKIFLKNRAKAPFPLEKKKGYFVATISAKASPATLKQWVDDYGTNGYLLLNTTNEDVSLKIKQAPHNPRGKYDEDFCKMTVTGKMKEALLHDILFDYTPGKETSIAHTFLINDIIIPKEYANDMAQARVNGKRKGKVIRIVTIDGKEEKKEKDFMA